MLDVLTRSALVVACTIVVSAHLPVAQAAPDRPLHYTDEEKVKRFDSHYRQAKANLDAADEERLRSDAFVRDFTTRVGNARQALDAVSVQDHGEVVKRRRDLEVLVTTFEQRRAAASMNLGAADLAAIQRCDAGGEEILAKLLAMDGKRTILTGDPRAPRTLFDAQLEQLRGLLAGIRNQEHADVVAARQRLTDVEDAVAARRAECAAKLAELGDVVRLTEDHVDWIIKHHHINAEHDRLLPRPPAEGDLDAFRAYARELKEAVAALQRRADFLAALATWDPRWDLHASVELKNRVRRALGLAQDAIKGAGARVALGNPSYNIVGSPLELSMATIDGLDVKTLRSAVAGIDHYGPALTETVTRAERAAAFQEEYSGRVSPELTRALADLRAKLARYEERVAKQLDAERLPPPGPAHARYIATARRLLPEALAIVLDGDLEHFEGVETSKQEIGRRGVGNGMEEVTYRVHEYPYDYDYLSGYAVFEENGPCKVYLLELVHHHRKYGDEPLGEWFVDGRYLQHCIRKENIQVPEVEEASEPAAPAPPSSPSDPASTSPAPVVEPVAAPDTPAEAPGPAAEAAPEAAASGLGAVVGVVVGGACCLLVLVAGGAAVFLARAKASAASPMPPTPPPPAL